ncbi:pullulanase 1, chloroplastic isoform X2 [Selaginella moellendorffii]|uniref:pullulanase 1, chloroplastic isoform X2 n=1 Tax=Selaginella moellendorffii TaxID=88036 RepID=UPI000D1C62F6|nr:pullulanase 1, chloroplastic isoform X2 [Selaginella moellendorffii]|eukprot:XP_002965238.2 pullulanase 1, chloroplastic isoform X2 [Selaginella moellendorffii]
MALAAGSSGILQVRCADEIRDSRALAPVQCRGSALRKSLRAQYFATRMHCLATARRTRLWRVRAVADSGPQSRRIHYHRNDGKYDEWGLHVWGSPEIATKWEKPLSPSGSDKFGVYWDLIGQGVENINFIIHRGDRQDGTGSMNSQHKAAWIVSERPTVFYDEPDLDNLPQGNLNLARVFWVNKDLLAWNVDAQDGSFFLHASQHAQLQLTGRGIEGADTIIQLEVDTHDLPAEVLERLPHISGYHALRLPRDADCKKLIKCQLAVGASNAYGAPIDASGVQLPGVLDDVLRYDGPLGVTFSETECTFSIWAPTAQNVRLFLYTEPSGGEPEAVIQLDEKHNVWTASGPKDWVGKYYLYEVTVFHPSTLQVEICLANDPYSRGLSANGERSLVIDLSDHNPENWDRLSSEKPMLHCFNDMAIYELHIRDFSARDQTVPENLRGTFLAFSEMESAGVRHLRSLAEAGLTHVHLLPSFDFGSVNEVKEKWKTLDYDRLEGLPPDSEEQQEAVVAIQNEDGFNWGYDPVNWGVPDGSYSTDPNGPRRTFEFRSMVQSINRLGLRVVLDVVYNHLHGNGPSDHLSVLDKVVPGYYLRRNKDGVIENSTCMNNTASEFYMVDRLIVDDLLMWATQYKVDGFRFDLMGHIMKRTMMRAKTALQSLTEEKDGVDGSKIYLYGEGWDFGEVYGNGRGVNATQLNLPGSQIGSFNDRMRDSAIGGSPFGDPLEQGIFTGLSLQPNSLPQGDEENMAKNLARGKDRIILGLAGNLRDYVFVDFEGREVKGCEVLTHDGKPVAYAASPTEIINYVSAHDNETLFDIIMMKVAESVSLEDRCRVNHLASSIVALSQAIPFFHAGEDMLRSKSLDRDSYNSGDWFNRLDFSYETNNWGVGLPPKSKNGEKWLIMRKLLGNESLRPSKDHILAAVANFQDLLKIRFSSPLFRLKTVNAIQARLQFHNTGPAAIPGIIVMSIHDGDEGEPGLLQIDSNFRIIVVVINARPDEGILKVGLLRGFKLELHPVQAASQDELVKASSCDDGTFAIPKRTTAVFVEKRCC